MMYDVIVVGGSYAGIAATLQLARARRKVLVVDAAQRRNRFATSAHGFLGQDGQAPEAIAAKGKAEVLAYSTVQWREAAVTDITSTDGTFAVRIGDEVLQSRRIILATGVVDELPAIPGIEQRWGKSIFHCPYCHGYELEKGRLGVLATNPLSVHQAGLVSEWASELTFFLNGVFEPDAEQLAELASRGVRVERERVTSIAGDAPAVDVVLADGNIRHLDGLFLATRMHVHSPFAERLGCELDSSPFGTFYKTDAMKETTVPGVFACGDVALPMGSVSFAVGDGVRAGVGTHQSLVFRRS